MHTAVMLIVVIMVMLVLSCLGAGVGGGSVSSTGSIVCTGNTEIGKCYNGRTIVHVIFLFMVSQEYTILRLRLHMFGYPHRSMRPLSRPKNNTSSLFSKIDVQFEQYAL